MALKVQSFNSPRKVGGCPDLFLWLYNVVSQSSIARHVMHITMAHTCQLFILQLLIIAAMICFLMCLCIRSCVLIDGRELNDRTK